MPDATFVAYIPNSVRDQLRAALLNGDTGGLRWSEKRSRAGSEFYFSGPPALARRTHEYVVQWALRRD